jgi:hypothetical protein
MHRKIVYQALQLSKKVGNRLANRGHGREDFAQRSIADRDPPVCALIICAVLQLPVLRSRQRRPSAYPGLGGD